MSSAPIVLPTVREALDDVAGDLRRCARLAGGTLVVELTAEGEAFGKVAVQDTSDRDIMRCVEDVITPLRFVATPQQFFAEEYMP